MLLCIDIGNTNVTFGLYEGGTLGPRWRIRTILEKMPTSTASYWTNCSATRATGPTR